MPKVINIEPTPNPDALKFLVNPALLKGGSRSFKDFGAAVGDPLGSCLFGLGKITSVFYMDRFVTVNKEPSAEWSDLIDPICDAIEDLKLPEDATGDTAPLTPGGDADATLARFNELLDTRGRPGRRRRRPGGHLFRWPDPADQLSRRLRLLPLLHQRHAVLH